MADIDDPFLPSDPTQRPRPGAGRRGLPESTVSPRPPQRVRRGRAAPGGGARVAGARPEPARAGRQPAAPADRPASRHDLDATWPDLRRQALDEIRQLRGTGAAAGVRNEIVLAARYALCAGLDEAVLSTPSGAAERMGAASAAGRAASRGVGRREVLRDARSDLGGSGAPHRPDGAAVPDRSRSASPASIRGSTADTSSSPTCSATLYRKIRASAAQPPRSLSLQWRGLEDRRNRLVRYVPWWVVVAAVLAILAVTFVVYYTWLARFAEPIQTKLAQVGIGNRPILRRRPPSEGRRCKKLLAARGRRRLLTVSRERRPNVVTLTGERPVRLWERRRESCLRGTRSAGRRRTEQGPGTRA